jgi:hypothetical protein
LGFAASQLSGIRFVDLNLGYQVSGRGNVFLDEQFNDRKSRGPFLFLSQLHERLRIIDALGQMQLTVSPDHTL